MNDSIIIYWVGKNNFDKIWGYLGHHRYNDTPPVYYAFWGKIDGKIQFYKIYTSGYYTRRKKLKKYKEIEENEIELNSSVKEQFTEYLLLCKLKHESYR